MHKIRLELIGTNYYNGDPKQGVVFTDSKDIPTVDNNKPRVNHRVWFANKDVQIKWYTDPDFAGSIQRNGKIKNNHFIYNRIDPNTLNNYTASGGRVRRASYIPFIKVEQHRYWLLGSFHDIPEIKVDFGGQCKPRESPGSCANRELDEETKGVYLEPIQRAIREGRTIVFRGTSSGVNNISEHVIFILADMTNDLGDLDMMQYKNQLQEKVDASNRVSSEIYGPLAFYREDLLMKGVDSNNGQRIYTAFSLTDFNRYLAAYFAS